MLAVDDTTRQGSLRYLDEDGMPLACSYPPVPRLSDLSELRRLAAAAGGFYTDIADALRAHALEPRTQMVELYRRVLFTILVSIIDEQWRAHCRAVGMTAEEIKRYEPAFDHEESRIARRLTGSVRV